MRHVLRRSNPEEIATVAWKRPSIANAVIDTSAVNEHCSST
jgi:hypothetical protein